MRAQMRYSLSVLAIVRKPPANLHNSGCMFNKIWCGQATETTALSKASAIGSSKGLGSKNSEASQLSDPFNTFVYLRAELSIKSAVKGSIPLTLGCDSRDSLLKTRSRMRFSTVWAWLPPSLVCQNCFQCVASCSTHWAFWALARLAQA